MADTLYARLGGYDAISAVADDLLPRLMATPGLAGSGSIAPTTACAARNNC
jgi:hypothetical protein